MSAQRAHCVCDHSTNVNEPVAQTPNFSDPQTCTSLILTWSDLCDRIKAPPDPCIIQRFIKAKGVKPSVYVCRNSRAVVGSVLGPDEMMSVHELPVQVPNHVAPWQGPVCVEHCKYTTFFACAGVGDASGAQ